jgi:RNA polymerase sigma-70 factor (ECF subfamily)
VTAQERDAVIAKFLGATATGDLQSLMDVLAPDVVLMTDGGGVKKAALRPIRGRDKVLRFLAAVAPDDASADVVVVNGRPALRLVVAGEVDAIGTMLVEGGLVTGLYLVRNPAKLARLDAVVALTR